MTIPKIVCNAEIIDLFPALRLGLLVSPVKVEKGSLGFDQQRKEILENAAKLEAEAIRNLPPVKSVKEAYKALGKDPNRYRPAAESLLRRISQGKGLYTVNNVVDCLNLTSVQTGFSICGYDRDKIEGTIHLGVGEADELYEGIGRGQLNIENLPVFRDDQGAFGTPTSDSKRTLVGYETQHVLMVIPAFEGDASSLSKTLDLLSDYLKRFVAHAEPKTEIIEA